MADSTKYAHQFIMKVDLRLAWELQSEPVETVLPALLRAIERFGSLAAAAREVGYSYRHVWNLFAKWERALGKPLARFERGRGARVTPLGLKLLELEREALGRINPQLEALAREFEAALAQTDERRELRLHASHDLAVARLPP